MPKRGLGGAREVVGVDVIGEDVVLGGEDGGATLQALERGAARTVLRVDAGDAQDGHPDAGGAAEVAQE